ncbi:MAG: hypothetical protein ACQEQX_10650, partial [Thermodesulfobacteriota bacterium]
MARQIAAEHPGAVDLEMIDPEEAAARGLDSKKSISLYLDQTRVPIKTALSKPDLEKRIQQ